VVVIAGYGAALGIPALQVMPENNRVEELAFRGVLLAIVSRVLPVRPALGMTSAVFRLWHIGSALRPSGAGVSPVLQGTSLAGVVVVNRDGGAVLS
jgi:membrane protease YdiL (CAAX protease family)